MPEPPDRVTPVIQEHAAEGGDPGEEFDATNILNDAADVQEDALEAAGVYLQDATYRDEQVLLWREGDNMQFKDVNNPSPGVSLSDLLGGGFDINKVLVDDVTGAVLTDDILGNVLVNQ